MEFQRIRIGAFGALRDLDTGPERLGRLVVVLGPNEAGKSTLFHFLTAMLYGLYPASRDRNPYTPWEGGDIEGGAVLRMEDGEIHEIHRRLLSAPSGALTRGPATEDLRNRTLPCAEHVPREVFRQVFALTLAELAALQGETWDRVQDRLVAGMGASDLASVRSAVEDLEREAGRLWRPTRMGNQRVRDLRERVRELRLKRRAASEADGRLRDAAREREQVAVELREARREREACHLYVERCQTLLPLRDRLERIDELRQEAGAAEDLEGLPPDPRARLAELETAVRRAGARQDGLDAEAADAGEREAAFGQAHRAILEREDEIREATARAAGLEPLRVRAAQLEQELRDFDRRCEEHARELLGPSWDRVDEEGVLAVPAGRLRHAVDRLREAREERRVVEEAARAQEDAGPASPRLPLLLGPVLAALGAVGLTAGLWAGRVAAAVAAAAVAGVGGALMIVERLVRTPRRSGRDDMDERLARARSAEADARSEVGHLLSGLPVREDLAQRPPPDLGAQLRRLQELVGDRRDRVGQLEEIRERLGTAEDDLRAVADAIGLGGESDPTVLAHRLGNLLSEAGSARNRADGARRDLERIGRERRAAAAELDEVRERRDILRERLAALARPEDDGLWAAEAVRARLEAHERARRLQQELEREHPDLDELRRRIRRFEDGGGDWTLDPATLAVRKAREKELAERTETLARRLEGLDKDMDYLRREETVGDVESEIEALQAELDASIRARDRLWVLSTLLREADRRFRDEHQPDILRRAGCHLATITAGRYRKILVDEAGDGRFLLEGPGYPGPVEVGEPISTGTREQVYLALRVAILDHLDRSGERLPLFMDEAFVNWDETRRERGFGLLKELARARQVFVFTCHEDMAGSLAARGGRVLELEGVG